MNEGMVTLAADPFGGMFGKFGAAGVGVTLLVIFYMMAKNSVLLYNAKRVKPWTDLVSMAVGIAAMSSLANLTGSVWAVPANILTNLINTLANIDITADLGMGAITCIIAFCLYFKESTQTQNIMYGCGMAILFPAAGGLWAIIETSLNSVVTSV